MTTRGPLLPYSVVSLPARGLVHKTCYYWGYGYNEDEGAHVATYCDQGGTPVAQKLRYADKKFRWVGDAARVGLYGDWLWSKGNRMGIVVTEGEIDALSVSQAQGNRYPVVSVPNGAPHAKTAVARNLSFLESFDRVTFMFDMDEVGRQAAEDCARLLTPGKAFVANLPAKDANDLLVQNRSRDIVNAIFEAWPWRPDGIVEGKEVWDAIVRGPSPTIAEWPYPELQQKLLGLRKGEITLLAAGIFSGKSTLCKAFASAFLDAGLTVGIVPLEETYAKFARDLLGMRVAQNVHLQDVPPEVLQPAWDEVSERLVFYDDRGQRGREPVFDQVRYMAVARECDVIILDHLTVVIGAQRENDDRKFADAMMSDLEGLVKRTQISLVTVMHLRKVGEGKPHEEGKAVSMSDIRGSGLIPALSHNIVAYERNQQAEDPTVANFRVLKCRETGRSGTAGRVKYDEATGQLFHLDEAEELLGTGADADF